MAFTLIQRYYYCLSLARMKLVLAQCHRTSCIVPIRCYKNMVIVITKPDFPAWLLSHCLSETDNKEVLPLRM